MIETVSDLAMTSMRSENDLSPALMAPRMFYSSRSLSWNKSTLLCSAVDRRTSPEHLRIQNSAGNRIGRDLGVVLGAPKNQNLGVDQRFEDEPTVDRRRTSRRVLLNEPVQHFEIDVSVNLVSAVVVLKLKSNSG